MIPSIIAVNSITVILPGGPLQITAAHPNFQRVRDLLRDKSEDAAAFERLMAPIKALTGNMPTPSNGKVEIVGREVHYNGVPVHSIMTERMLDLMDEGFDISPWERFMEKLYLNPSFTSVTELYGFLEFADLPITEDGDFIAYKYVSESYRDCYSGTFDNSIGATCEMPRHQVNDNREITCSTGLHVCSWEYLPNYMRGCKVVMVKVNPANVVSVPKEYRNTKMRVCKYEVIADVTEAAHAGPLKFTAVVQGSGSNWNDAPVSEVRPDPELDDEESEWDEECGYCGSMSCDGDCEKPWCCACGDPDCEGF